MVNSAIDAQETAPDKTAFPISSCWMTPLVSPCYQQSSIPYVQDRTLITSSMTVNTMSTPIVIHVTTFIIFELT